MMVNPKFEKATVTTENKQLPVRVVMNKDTITIFGSDVYISKKIVFNILSTKFYKSQDNPNCFILSEYHDNKIRELCPFGFDLTSHVYNEWSYDFNLFKYQCHMPKETILNKADNLTLMNDLNKKLNEAKDDAVFERTKMLEKELEIKDENDLERKAYRTNNIANIVIAKELDIEAKLKKEEELKQETEEHEIAEQIEREKQKGKM